MGKKPDLSRLVVLQLTPTEAALLRGLFESVGPRIEPSPEGLALVAVIAEQSARIELQLRALLWPLDAGKRAPYPL